MFSALTGEKETPPKPPVRFRLNARMVERVIGRRIGTGGSSGVDYLDETARYRIFPDLWAIRTLLLPRAVLPPLQNADFYHFAAEHIPPP